MRHTTATTLPALTGTPAQIAKATDVRDAAIADLASLRNHLLASRGQEQANALDAAIAARTSASWWIARRAFGAVLALRKQAMNPAPAPAGPIATVRVTARQAAERLGVSLTTVYRRCRSGALTATKTRAGRWEITLPITLPAAA
jgi:excisionase family DNA binding protein